MSLNTVYASILNGAIADVASVLTTFAADPLFAEKFALAFGKPISAEQFLQGVAVLPEIEVVTDSELQGALGAFSSQTQKIYLSQGLVAGDSARLRSVLIEEIGHYLDAQVNSVDSPGDEGAIFAAVVLGQDLSASQLAQLKAEDDHGVIDLNGEVIEVEQATGANLVVTDFTAPATALSGQTISLSWTVQNQGQDPTTSSYWYDEVYYSIDDVFGNNDDVYLTYVYAYADSTNLPLDSDETYTFTTYVNLPTDLIGDGYLLVKTDGGNHQAETDETDNVKSVAISVTAPEVNLVVTDFTAPATALSGQTISLSWTVQNQGQDPTTSSDWYDYVYYSTDDVFGNSDDVYIAYNYPSSLPLDPNETYTVTTDVTLPPDLIGNGYLLVKTDGYNAQAETDETDNVKSVEITVTAPQANLVVTDFTAPDTALSGQSISLSWTVQNQGQDPATFTYNYYEYYYYWNDSIVYSTDDVFGNSDDVYLTGIQADSYNANLPLDPNETYTLTANVTLPQDLIGNGYLLIKSDGYNERTEIDETDNVNAVAISVTAPDVDLVVTDFTAPTTASLGQTISLSWTVKNQGTVATSSSYWYDSVYYSTDDVFGNSDDVYLAYGYATNLPLDPDESYTLTANVTLPSNLSGSGGYLFVKTDYDNYQTETDETDNTYSVPIAISKPNLVVTDLTAPTSANIGQAISVSWTVKNQGTVATNSSYWYDYVYYSTDDVFGNSDDVYLTYVYAYSANANLPLDPNESYTLTANVTLPSNNLSGSGYLFVKTDGDNYQTEIDETDNTYSVPITISGANLVITSATAPTTANSGQTVALSWTVENKGDGATTASNWYDQVVFSKDTTFGNSDDINITGYISISSYANLPLDPDKTYTINQNIALPNSIGGSGYLLFKTDSYSYYYQAETNEQDNVYSLAIDVTAPNLVISNPTAPPASAILGETIAVSWQVSNTGTVSANGDWYDSVYLSNDDKLDSSDTYLTYAWTGNKTPLAAGTSYTISQNLTLPSSAGVGNHYLLFVADAYYAYNYQGETSETDNVVATPISLSAPDLIVSATTAPETGVARGKVDVSWTVKNQGTVSAPADWYDYVYLSTDNIFGTNDSLVAYQYISEQTPLAADGSYTIDSSVTLPNVAPGNYYLLFKADGGNSQGETDETNNVYAVAITVTAPDLVVSTATAPTNGIANGAIAVSYTVTNQGNVDSSTNWYDYIYLSTNATYDYGDTYVSYQYISSPTSLGAGESYTQDINLTLPNRPAGDYYLLFLADAGNYQYETDETNNNRAVPITIGVPDLSISEATAPTSGGLGESVTLSWKVSNSSTVTAPADWTDRVYFSLDDVWDSSDSLVASESITTQTPLIAANDYSISKSFTLPNQTNAIGSGYLLFVTDADKTQAETSETNNVQAVAFTLNAPNLVVTSANASSSVAVGETINVTWDVTNQGTVAANADWYDSVYISNDATFDSSDQWLSYRESSSDTPLGAGTSYTGSLNVTLPTTATGDRYLLFVADNYYYYSYYNLQGETNENDNFYAVPINISAADLTIDAATAPSTAIAGETVELSWTVKNQGTGQAARDWSDYVYLSLNNSLDSSDILLSSESVATQTPLASGDSYTITKNVALSNTAIGQRYLIVVADGSQQQGETNENNNVWVTPINLTDPAKVEFSAANYSINEDGTPITAVTLNRTNGSSGELTVTVNLSNGTAIAGSDYTNSPITVTFADGETSKTVTIPIINDTQFEADETLNLTLTNPQGTAVLGNQTTAVLTIINDDLPQRGVIVTLLTRMAQQQVSL
jgi:subtilase family serine protease